MAVIEEFWKGDDGSNLHTAAITQDGVCIKTEWSSLKKTELVILSIKQNNVAYCPLPSLCPHILKLVRNRPVSPLWSPSKWKENGSNTSGFFSLFTQSNRDSPEQASLKPVFTKCYLVHGTKEIPNQGVGMAGYTAVIVCLWDERGLSNPNPAKAALFTVRM